MLKTIPKILITIFLFIFLIQLASVIFLLAIPKNSQAITFTPQVGVGDFEKGTPETVGNSTAMIANYINAIYKYALGVVGILATVVLMFGGVLWIIAGGNAERITNAKSWITAALTGLVLALTSYMILYIVNPGLVNFRITPIKDVTQGEEIIREGCCEWAGSNTCDDGWGEKECEEYNDGDGFGEYIGLNYTCSKILHKCLEKGNWYYLWVALETNGETGPFLTKYICEDARAETKWWEFYDTQPCVNK